MRNYLSKPNLLLLSMGIIITLVFIAISCIDSNESYKPRSLGAPGELLVVADNDYQDLSHSNTIDSLLQDIYPGLPQFETMFTPTKIKFPQFQRHFRTYRNILLVSIDSDAVNSQIEYHKNEWAINQQVVQIVANNEAEVNELLIQKWPKIKGFFYNGDIDALVKSYQRVYQPEPVSAVKSHYSFSLYFPKGFKVKKKDKDFCWLVNDRPDSHMGVFVFEYPLDSLENINALNLLHLRNKILKQQVPGQNPGSYMTTEDNFPVSVNKSLFAGRKWIELRGLWKVNGDFMGGPFVDYFYADYENHKLIMLEGYVYAPAKPNKAEYVRQVEAVLKTFLPV